MVIGIDFVGIVEASSHPPPFGFGNISTYYANHYKLVSKHMSALQK